MIYDNKTVKEELENMGFVKNGLIGFGQTAMNYGGGLIGSIIANAVANKFAIVQLNDKIMVIPFEDTKINYEKAQSFEKEDLKKAKVCGGIFSYRRLKIVKKNGASYKFYITSGKNEVKTMLNNLGFNLKEEKTNGKEV